MADIEQTTAFGEHGEPCEECGAPLAADQRYCLNCGRRRGEARVGYRQAMGVPTPGQVEAQQAPEPPAAQQEPAPAERDYAPLAAVGGIAVLGLMLLVGVLIGKGDSSPPAAPAPIVRVGGAETSETASAGPAGGSQGPSPKPKAKARAAGKEAKAPVTGAKTVEGGLTGTAARNSDATVQASEGDLQALEGQSGESYEEAVKKLPDKIATPGAPPPIDKTKAPGAGGAAESIE